MNPIKHEFFYHRKDGHARLFTRGMDLIDVSIEPSYIARLLYKSIMKQEPEKAELFRRMVIDAITSDETWDLKDEADPSDETGVPN